MLTCKDDFATTFDSYPEMIHFHESLSKGTVWRRCKVKDLHVEPLDASSALCTTPSAFVPGTSEDAVADTVENLGLALRVGGDLYPLRTTAYKTLLDRAKISGTALPKLKKAELAAVLNACLAVHSSDALLLVRDEKVSATHSGDVRDYSVLPIDELLHTLEKKMDARFPGYHFENGYCDHAYTSGCWTFPDQKEDMLGTYAKTLQTKGMGTMAAKLVPGIRFLTSDTGVASAKVSAMLMGSQHPIHIGSCISVDHRLQRKVEDFDKALDQLFAQFCDSVSKLQTLLEIELQYPVNAMTRICKKFSLPKKEALEAIAMFEISYGGGTATAHDVFMALQEIPWLMKANKHPEAKLLNVEENMARALSIRWSDFDLAKAVNY
ncbi:MAG: hypothetical protein IKB09_00895 [Oscillospiraceae bacterium]|nr:hypothetical protein [Oscillospiraceae bacterium]